ncbi:cellulase family glycosylhydrolase [Ferruginibacter paludis]|uniref:cellulase family glycosylhydrolase n=1 Tax=Ferruginibacter paludis TaxID=1310417 RepID=UPI0025B5FA55|nr:cellulase family glycosylhydrolase [Ferruginibacter paludis]MDN3656162.1 cellulase family glycosylhydrolase [Ferruginibacter paludis]
MKTCSAPIESSADTAAMLRWPEEKINAWYNKNPWPIGCNYIPQYAINQLEMWQEESFDANVIDKELSWASGLGFNTIRVFLHHLLWEQDSNGFLKRIDSFLSIASRYNIKTMFVFFDAVWNPFPKLGIQPDPRHYVHNSGWVQCPGYDVLNDVSKYDRLQDYVAGVVNHFKNDERILIWDLFNEPDNMNTASYKDDNYALHKAELSMSLLTKCILWVRAINPIQPITMAPWQFDWSDPAKLTALDNYMFTHSDVISFHCYEDKKGMEKRINSLKRYNRPMMCTEYMARPFNSTFQQILPLLKKHNIGAYNWGFVAGKSQTFCPWDSWQQPYTTEPPIWFHDVLRTNGEPYDKKEVAYLIKFNRKNIKKIAC